MSKKQHYVDNKEFLAAMIEWKESIREAESEGDEIPPITEYIGECFYKIATHLSYRPNFINYTYREEMIGDGIENCIQYAKNFDPEKSKNPFAYFTQIIYYAFLRRISKEKKQQSIKQKMIDNDTLKTHETMDFDDEVYDNTYIDFLKDNLPQEEFPKKKKKTKRGIEHFVEE
jgi:hypothetical protein|tara:strand:+ start:912 stop:1430 length:519 start_codon:yes stop_codon:yes gene_type:complete